MTEETIDGQVGNSTKLLSSAASREIRELILRSAQGLTNATLYDIYIYNAQLKSKCGWEDFQRAIRHLTSEGLLEGIGDGFVVHYAMSQKGQEALRSGKW